MEQLNIHMKNIHQESDHERIYRVTETVKSALAQESLNGNEKVYDCSECGLIFNTSDEQNNHNQKDHASGLIPEIIRDTKSEEKVIDLTDSEYSSSDNYSDDEEEINIDYEYFEDSETFKGHKPLFKQSVIALKKLISDKGEHKIINKHKMVVRDVRGGKYDGIEAEIEVSKGEEKGVATIKIWGPSKAAKAKKKCTVMIVKFSSCEEKFAKMLSRKIIKPLLDSYLKGKGWKSLIKSDIIKKERPSRPERTACPDCEKPFTKGYIKTHMERMHIVKCDICEKSFKTQSDMKNHRKLTHSQAAIDIVQDVLNTKKEADSRTLLGVVFIGSHCKNHFKTNMLLIAHKEKEHIDDNWPDSGSKRTVSMVKTSSMSEPKKKRTADEDEMRERSNNMDRKILEKRKEKRT